jgi:hypothetical protein
MNYIQCLRTTGGIEVRHHPTVEVAASHSYDSHTLLQHRSPNIHGGSPGTSTILTQKIRTSLLSGIEDVHIVSALNNLVSGWGLQGNLVGHDLQAAGSTDLYAHIQLNRQYYVKCV